MPGSANIKAGAAFYELSLKDGKLTKGLARWGNKLKHFGAVTSAWGKSLGKYGAAITGAFAAAETSFASTAESIALMSKQTGVGVGTLQRLGFAAKQSGVNSEALGHGLSKMQESVGKAEEGNGAAIDSFAQLGLSIGDLAGMSPEKQFEAIASGIQGISDPAKRTADAMAIFGKSGDELLPLLSQGASGIAAYAKQANDLGLVMSGPDVAAGESIASTFKTLTAQFGAVKNAIGASVAPAFQVLGNAVKSVMTNATGWINQNREVVVGVAAVGAGLLTAGIALIGFGKGLSIAGTAMKALGTGLKIIPGILGMMLSPTGLVVAAIGGLGALWLTQTESGHKAMRLLKDTFASLAHTATETFGGIKDALAAGDWGLAGSIAMAGLRVGMLTGFGALSKAIGGEMGDMVGSLGKDIAGGNFKGAWDTVVIGMGKLWSEFSKGVVTAFSAAANAVLKIWKHVDGEIANWMQKEIQEGSFLGQFLDANNMNEASGGRDEDMKVAANNKRLAAEVRRNNAGRTDLGPLGSQQAVQASSIIDSQAANLSAGLKAMQLQADRNEKLAGQKFASHVQGGASGLQAALADAKKQLDALSKKAAAEHKAAMPGDVFHSKPWRDLGGAMSSMHSMASGVFNANVAGRALGTQESPMIQEQRRTNAELKKLVGMVTKLDFQLLAFH